MNRRDFLSAATMAGAVAAVGATRLFARENSLKFYCFTKHLQWLDYQETAEVLKNAGYDGADLVVRPGGHVEPERVEDDLPKAVAAFKAVGLAVPMMVTHVTRADDPLMEKVLRVGFANGVRLYRMGYLNYDDKLGIEDSIAQLRPQVQELADLNRQIGITGAYQNHAGTNIGASVWDLRQLLRGIDPTHLGIQYDIKHATAEGGRSWILGLKLVAEHINCLALKDFLWQKNTRGNWRDDPVPMGTGMVDYPKFFETVKQLGIRCPITMHIEYPTPSATQPNAPRAENKAREIEICRRDLGVAKKLLREAQLL